jgi:hypothetical protein
VVEALDVDLGGGLESNQSQVKQHTLLGIQVAALTE